MNLALKVTAAYLDSQEIKYTILGEEEDKLSVVSRAENKDSVEIIAFFGEDNTDVCIKSFDVAKFPEAKKADIYKVCNELNADFRWVKFYVDERDNTVTAQEDAVVQLDSCGEECYELMARMVGIIDEGYPKLMKAIWCD